MYIYMHKVVVKFGIYIQINTPAVLSNHFQ